MQSTTDFIVVGSGIAGLNAALTLAKHGKVVLLTKAALRDCATFFAQGGIAAVTTISDNISLHVNDTIIAGNRHNNVEAVSFLVEHGKDAIEKLHALGVPFDIKPDGSFATSFEAAHSYPRVLHATDFTGQKIEEALIKNVLLNSNITTIEHAFVTDLIIKDNTCYGITFFDSRKDRSSIQYLFARATVLATGGAGQVYEWTVTPSVVTGDGIAMAHRAGAALADLEFVQFHPTAFQGKTNDKKEITQMFLLSEALRGEGALLVDGAGNRFMRLIHPNAELAPRDVVSRAIFQQQKKGDVYLDIRHKSKSFLVKRFPNIYKTLLSFGFDLSKDFIPVTPAVHFMCGGIITDLYGRTSIDHLFAYGEVAATGVHGANRLASNSLLEGFVFSSKIEKCLDLLPTKANVIVISQKPYIRKEDYTIQKQVKHLMWEHVGIERSEEKLSYAIETLTTLLNQFEEGFVSETKNMVQVSLLIATAAGKRKKSLGAHFMKG